MTNLSLAVIAVVCMAVRLWFRQTMTGVEIAIGWLLVGGNVGLWAGRRFREHTETYVEVVADSPAGDSCRPVVRHRRVDHGAPTTGVTFDPQNNAVPIAQAGYVPDGTVEIERGVFVLAPACRCCGQDISTFHQCFPTLEKP